MVVGGSLVVVLSFKIRHVGKDLRPGNRAYLVQRGRDPRRGRRGKDDEPKAKMLINHSRE